MKTFKLVKPSKYGNILLNDITSMRNFPKCPICPTETTQNQDHIKKGKSLNTDSASVP